jgi:hypothetical protein
MPIAMQYRPSRLREMVYSALMPPPPRCAPRRSVALALGLLVMALMHAEQIATHVHDSLMMT